jgi:hypothetical protein
LNNITKPGRYKMAAEDYHADPVAVPSLSSSIAKLLIGQTALHAWTAHPRFNPGAEEENEARFDRGKACHILVLGDEERFQVVTGFDDWRKKEAQERRAQARANGLIPLLEHQMMAAREMHAAFLAQISQHRDSADIFTGGECEQTLVWKESVRDGEVWCRSLLDYLPADPHRQAFGDYKTLDANVNPDTLQRYAFSAGWDMQDAFYRRGIQKALGVEDPAFKFVVQEATPPYSLVIVDFPPEAKQYADAKVDEALDLWAYCIKTGNWPGYPAFTCTLEVPPWIGGEFEARKVRKDNARREGRELYADMLAFQAPT